PRIQTDPLKLGTQYSLKFVGCPLRSGRPKRLCQTPLVGCSQEGTMLPLPASLSEFEARFATETACVEYLRDRRWGGRFQCPSCAARWIAVSATRSRESSRSMKATLAAP